jgi:hypothetical protein
MGRGTQDFSDLVDDFIVASLGCIRQGKFGQFKSDIINI